MSLSLRVEVFGNPYRIYHPGDQVVGKVALNTAQQEVFKSLKVNFHGLCRTSTTRPYMVGNDLHTSRRTYDETTPLFEQEEMLFRGPFTLSSNMHEWHFSFIFPSHSENTSSRSVNLNHFTKSPHALPPSFHSYTNTVGGEGSIEYSIEAVLLRSKLKPEIKSMQQLLFRPRARRHQASAYPVILNVITKPYDPQDDEGSSIPKAKTSGLSLARELKGPSIRFIPTIHLPQAVTPAQTIPIQLSVKQIRRIDSDPLIDVFTVDSLQISLTTSTRILCGGRLNSAQDHVTKTVKCVDRKNTGISITMDDKPQPLTRAFALVDNEEASPSFRSFTVSRRYEITIDVALTWRNRVFHVSKTTNLDILPRYTSRRRQLLEEDVIDPLPLYTPSELAPGYDEAVQVQGKPKPNAHSSRSPSGSSESLSSSSVRSNADSEGSSNGSDSSRIGTPMTILSPMSSIASTPGLERPFEGAESYFPPSYEEHIFPIV